MNKTGIEWTDFSANPLRYRDAAGESVWGCVKHSTGCAHCYSETLAHRYGKGGPFTAATMRGLTPCLDEAELKKMLTYKPASGKRCFLADMTDLFGEWVPDDLLDQLFAVLFMRSDVTWQVLTKRADRMAAYLSADDLSLRLHERVKQRMGYDNQKRPAVNRCDLPLRNVWCGTSVENQAAADERIPHLLRAPVAVRFLSVEPLLGPVDLANVRFDRHLTMDVLEGTGVTTRGPCGQSIPNVWSQNKVNWVIVGGESGPRARLCRVDWVRSCVRQCQAAGVSCFVKQLGSNYADEANGVCGHATRWPFDVLPGGPTRRLTNQKGGDMSEFPEDLRVRQLPDTGTR